MITYNYTTRSTVTAQMMPPRPANMTYNLGYSSMFRVRESNVHGNGLFALRTIHKNEVITYYDGDLLDWNEAARASCKRYMRGLCHGHSAIDGLRNPVSGRGAGSFCNHSQNSNACFWKRNDIVWIKALRDISALEEICVNYGRHYWKRLFE